MVNFVFYPASVTDYRHGEYYNCGKYKNVSEAAAACSADANCMNFNTVCSGTSNNTSPCAGAEVPNCLMRTNAWGDKVGAVPRHNTFMKV